MSTLNRVKKITSILAIALALIFCGMIIGGLLQHHWEQNHLNIGISTGNDEGGIPDLSGAVLNSSDEKGIKITKTLIEKCDYAANGISEKTEKAYALVATIEPADVILNEVDWLADFVNASSEWAIGKNVGDYVKVTPDTGNHKIARVSCKQAFGEQIKVTAVARYNTQAYATCTVDYVKKVVNASIVTGLNSPDTAHQGCSLRIGSETDITARLEMSPGTLNGNMMIGNTGNITVELSQAYKAAIFREDSKFDNSYIANPAKFQVSGNSTIKNENGNKIIQAKLNASILSFMDQDKALMGTAEDRTKFENAFIKSVIVAEPHGTITLTYSIYYNNSSFQYATVSSSIYFYAGDLSPMVTAIKIDRDALWF